MNNRSMPDSAVIPVLPYPDVAAAALWLEVAFGFRPRLRIGNHRIQMHAGGGAIVVAQGDKVTTDGAAAGAQSVMVRVADVDAHHRRASAAGAAVSGAPADQPYGERQYSARDPAGHTWTFSQSIADVDPAAWGGTLVG